MQQEFITVTFNRTKIAIRCSDILYVIMSDDYCRIHMFDGNVYCCRMTLKELKKQLNEEFMKPFCVHIGKKTGKGTSDHLV